MMDKAKISLVVSSCKISSVLPIFTNSSKTVLYLWLCGTIGVAVVGWDVKVGFLVFVVSLEVMVESLL